MSKVNWNTLLPAFEQIEAMEPDKLSAAGETCQQYGFTLGLGIAAIGNLLACTASNGDTGLSDDAATNLGWMLETLGNLSAKLVDTGYAIEQGRADARVTASV